MDKWLLIRRHRHLARQGMIGELTCYICERPVTWQLNDDADPYMWCAWCDRIITPGVSFWDGLQVLQSEFFLEG